MRVIIFGATGMVGGGALIECLDDARVSSVLVVVRSPCGVKHTKLEEVLHDNFLDFSAIASRFADCDACFYCVGVSAVGISDEKYVRLTYDFTVAAAEALARANPAMTFCFISAAGAETNSSSRLLWVRTKGRAESAVTALPFSAVYVLRPGFIRPMKGVRSRTTAYQIIYTATGPVIPLLQRLFPKSITTTINIGRALIELANPLSARRGATRRTLDSAAINVLAQP